MQNVDAALNFVQHLLILASTAAGSVSIFSFGSLVGTLIDTECSAVGSQICGITEGVKKYQSIAKKKRKKHDSINSIKFWIA